MATLSTANRDLLHSLSWYMSARQTALRAALSFRTQLSVTDQIDIRVHYSGYFLNLLAATELLGGAASVRPNDFFTLLYSRFAFDGFPDGTANYSYIREMRNSVVHRGLDITSGAHIDGNFPMFVAPETVTSQPRKDGKAVKTYAAFDKYLLHIIAKCEAVVGQAMLDFLTAAGFIAATIDTAAAVAEYREAVELSSVMPEFAKTLSRISEVEPKWFLDAHNSMLDRLRAALMPCDTAKPA
jgi:hypothetical protein